MIAREHSENYGVVGVLLGLCALLFGTVLAVWLVWHGIVAVGTMHFNTPFGIRGSTFRAPLYGVPAVFAGLFFILLGLSFAFGCLACPPIRSRLPSWLRLSPWWFFAASMLFYAITCYMSKA